MQIELADNEGAVVDERILNNIDSDAEPPPIIMLGSKFYIHTATVEVHPRPDGEPVQIYREAWMYHIPV